MPPGFKHFIRETPASNGRGITDTAMHLENFTAVVCLCKMTLLQSPLGPQHNALDTAASAPLTPLLRKAHRTPVP